MKNLYHILCQDTEKGETLLNILQNNTSKVSHPRDLLMSETTNIIKDDI